jgi:hypothetical protein
MYANTNGLYQYQKKSNFFKFSSGSEIKAFKLIMSTWGIIRNKSMTGLTK